MVAKAIREKMENHQIGIRAAEPAHHMVMAVAEPTPIIKQLGPAVVAPVQAAVADGQIV
jgi:hypothetical protein